MSTTASPYGMRPIYHPSGLDRARAYTIDAAYSTAIYRDSPVILDTNGTIVIGTTAADILGAFQGCEYIDATGKPCVSNFWPGTAGATAIVAWVLDDPDVVYEMQANGAVPQTAVGDQADFVNPGNGSTSTGLSTAAFNSTLKGAGVQGQLRIVGFGRDLNDTVNDAYTTVRVQIARHQFVAVKVAI